MKVRSSTQPLQITGRKGGEGGKERGRREGGKGGRREGGWEGGRDEKREGHTGEGGRKVRRVREGVYSIQYTVYRCTLQREDHTHYRAIHRFSQEHILLSRYLLQVVPVN